MADATHLVECWQAVGDPPPQELGSARVLLAEVGGLLGGVEGGGPLGGVEGGGPLMWLEEEQVLATDLLTGGPEPFRIAFRPAEASLVLLDHLGSVLATRPLEGSGVQAAAEWLRDQIGHHGARLVVPELGHREPVTPAHRAALTELSHWLANAERLLDKLARSTEDATPVRFEAARGELSTHICLAGRSGEPAREVTVGLSCGDASVAEPYFFARPRPVHANGTLPPLPTGARWVREPDLEAVMPCSSVTSDRDAAAQAGRVVAFVEAAVPAAHGLLHRSWARR